MSQAKRPWLLLLAAVLGSSAGVLAMAWAGYARYLAAPPLPAYPTPHEAAVTAPLTPRVVIVIIDSLREDAANDPSVAPTLNEMADLGASGVNITPPMTLTALSVTNMATGMTPPIAWSIRNFDASPFPDESVFSLLRSAGHRIALLGDASWTQLFGAHAERTLAFPDTGFFAGVHGEVSESDLKTFAEAERVLADPSFTVVVIHVTASDKTAHKAGAHLREADGSPSLYARAIRAIDARVGALWRRHGPGSTWLVMSDHGCNLHGSHGGGEEVARRAPFTWAGPGIAKARGVEQPLNSVAAAIAALAGLRAPRTAEAHANFALLTTTADQQEALITGHLAARRRFVEGRTGEDVGTGAGLRSLNDALKRAEEEPWLGALSLVIGLLLQLLVVYGAARAVGVERPGVGAALWAGLSWPLLAWGGWQFKTVQVLGELFASPSLFALRGAILLAISGLMLFAATRFRKVGAQWVAWAFGVLVCGQVTLRWPGGPVSESLRTVVAFGLIAATAYAFRVRSADRRALAIGLGGLFSLFGLIHMSAMAGPEASMTLAGGWMANTLMMVTLVLLGAQALGVRRAGPDLLLWATLLGLAAASMVYQRAPAPWLVQLLVSWLAGTAALCFWVRLSPLAARNVLFALGLILYRALCTDARVVIVCCIAGLAWLLSGIRTRNNALTAPLIAGLTVIGQLAYFYEAGYSFSFSSLDMNVAFAATRDAIDLGEGFMFLMLQALGPWLVLIGAAVYNRTINDDPRGVRALVIALPGALVIQAWGAIGSFGYELGNHWFTVHAVPMVLFSACNILLVGVALSLSMLVQPAQSSSSRLDARRMLSEMNHTKIKT